MPTCSIDFFVIYEYYPNDLKHYFNKNTDMNGEMTSSPSRRQGIRRLFSFK